VGEEGDRLGADYLEWREKAEWDYLNEIGAAGFELVSVSREVVRESSTSGMTHFYAFSIIRCHAYFKRPAVPGAPEPPTRQIGFQPPAGD
jgi:acyl-CoA thioesterase FadM